MDPLMRALLALYRNHPDTPPALRYSWQARQAAHAESEKLLAWAATQSDDVLLACRNLGRKSLAWIRANQPDVPVNEDIRVTITEKELRDAWLRNDAVGDRRTAHAVWMKLLEVLTSDGLGVGRIEGITPEIAALGVDDDCGHCVGGGISRLAEAAPGIDWPRVVHGVQGHEVGDEGENRCYWCALCKEADDD